MVKSETKKTAVPEVEPQTLTNWFVNLAGIFEDDLPYAVLCVITSVVTIVVTVVFLINRFKRERNEEEPPAGEGDKKENEVQKEKPAIDKDGVDGENPDTSEGQDGSEEDLPWILQKAPSQTTLSADEKENWTNDEKQSEGTESEKSQDFAKLRKSAAGDLDGATKGVKVITAEDEYVEE